MNRQEPPQIRLEQVSVKTAIGSHTLLRDISFELFPGDRLAIVGAAGAGKTTLLRLLNRLTEASQGNIEIEQQSILQIPVLQLRQQIVLVPQESRLLGMTVRQALAYPLRLRGLSSSVIQQRLDTWIEQMRLPSDWLDRTEVQLSVGQRQWVAIARALIIQPKVLLLDEPTSALDAGRANQLITLLTDIAQTQAMTMVMVNHQLDLAQQFATRLLYLHHGQLRQDQAAHQVDWSLLKEQLIQTNAEVAEDWD